MKWEAATTTNKATPVRPQLQPLGKRLPLLGRRGSLRQIIYSVPRTVGSEYQENDPIKSLSFRMTLLFLLRT